ncbi:Ash family protein [Raoultella planticola]|nr:Ash family protein [Raoultella planticola]TDX38860.1 Ash family protein [Raoultella planticola]
MNKPTSTRMHLTLLCAGDRDGGRASSQQNNSLKSECVGGRKAGNSTYDALVGFYGCLLVVIGNGADRQKKKGRILPLGTRALIRALSHSDSLGFLRCRRCSSSRATLMICWISSPALVPISSTRVSASREDSSKASSLPSDCLRAISLRAAVTKKPAVDSPLNFAASISSRTSCGIRIDICLDLSLLVFVAMWAPVNRVCDSVYTKINHIKCLLCDLVWYNLNHTLSTGSKQIRHKNGEARRCDNTNGPLTTSDRTSIEVAMSNRTTPPAGRASLSPNLFLWRFLALNDTATNAGVCRSDCGKGSKVRSAK